MEKCLTYFTVTFKLNFFFTCTCNCHCINPCLLINPEMVPYPEYMMKNWFDFCELWLQICRVKNILHPKSYSAEISSCLDNCRNEGSNLAADTNVVSEQYVYLKKILYTCGFFRAYGVRARLFRLFNTRNGALALPAPPIAASLILSAKLMRHRENHAKILVWKDHNIRIIYCFQRLENTYLNYICQREWGLSRAGERRGKKVPHPPPCSPTPLHLCSHNTHYTVELQQSWPYPQPPACQHIERGKSLPLFIK